MIVWIIIIAVLLSAVLGDPCKNASTLPAKDRLLTRTVDAVPVCDQDLVEGWYKLELPGNLGKAAQIPTKCLKNNVCGTEVPYWLDLGEDGQMPEKEEQEVNASFCASYDVLGKVDCCVMRTPARIRNCGSAEGYIYYLRPTDRCPIAYCAYDPAEEVEPKYEVSHGQNASSLTEQPTEAVTQPIDKRTTGSSVDNTTANKTLPVANLRMERSDNSTVKQDATTSIIAGMPTVSSIDPQVNGVIESSTAGETSNTTQNGTDSIVGDVTMATQTDKTSSDQSDTPPSSTTWSVEVTQHISTVTNQSTSINTAESDSNNATTMADDSVTGSLKLQSSTEVAPNDSSSVSIKESSSTDLSLEVTSVDIVDASKEEISTSSKPPTTTITSPTEPTPKLTEPTPRLTTTIPKPQQTPTATEISKSPSTTQITKEPSVSAVQTTDSTTAVQTTDSTTAVQTTDSTTAVQTTDSTTAVQTTDSTTAVQTTDSTTTLKADLQPASATSTASSRTSPTNSPESTAQTNSGMSNRTSLQNTPSGRTTLQEKNVNLSSATSTKSVTQVPKAPTTKATDQLSNITVVSKPQTQTKLPSTTPGSPDIHKNSVHIILTANKMSPEKIMHAIIVSIQKKCTSGLHNLSQALRIVIIKYNLCHDLREFRHRRREETGDMRQRRGADPSKSDMTQIQPRVTGSYKGATDIYEANVVLIQTNGSHETALPPDVLLTLLADDEIKADFLSELGVEDAELCTSDSDCLVIKIPKQSLNSTHPEEKTSGGIFNTYMGLFIAMIVIGSLCLIFIVAGLLYIRSRSRRRSWDTHFSDLDRSRLNGEGKGHIVIENPATDEEIMKDEQMAENENGKIAANGKSMARTDEENNGWVVPIDQLTQDEKDGPGVEDTKL